MPSIPLVRLSSFELPKKASGYLFILDVKLLYILLCPSVTNLITHKLTHSPTVFCLPYFIQNKDYRTFFVY